MVGIPVGQPVSKAPGSIVVMTTRMQSDYAVRKEEELVATFGEAQLFRDRSGRLRLKGGSEEEREQARRWFRMFQPKSRALTLPNYSA